MLKSNQLSSLLLLAAGIQSFFRDTEAKREDIFVQTEEEKQEAIAKAKAKRAEKNAKRKAIWTGNT